MITSGAADEAPVSLETDAATCTATSGVATAIARLLTLTTTNEHLAAAGRAAEPAAGAAQAGNAGRGGAGGGDDHVGAGLQPTGDLGDLVVGHTGLHRHRLRLAILVQHLH